MEAKQWTTVDKSGWKMRGEWDDEPDKMQWQDEATGLPCLIVRGPSGALCGYVGVSEGHKFYGTDYNDVMFDCGEDGDPYPEAHGGLTFSDFCADTNDHSRYICHIPGPGEPDRVWWLGFDCAHSGDLCPSYSRIGFSEGYDTYRNVAYVKNYCRKLAAQLASVRPESESGPND